MYVRTYMRAMFGFFLDGAWSSWHLHVGCLHIIVWAVCSVPFFLVNERGGPLREALVHLWQDQTFLAFPVLRVYTSFKIQMTRIYVRAAVPQRVC